MGIAVGQSVESSHSIAKPLQRLFADLSRHEPTVSDSMQQYSFLRVSQTSAPHAMVAGSPEPPSIALPSVAPPSLEPSDVAPPQAVIAIARTMIARDMRKG